MNPRRETKTYPVAGIKSIDTVTGNFEAIVSVFGNVDLHGHRIAADAFDASIARWKTSGDPIPVIFSHQWDDLSAYLGTVDPADVKALLPGDPSLPSAIADFGGLLVKGIFDTTEPEGRKAAKLLKSRAIREFSFAYDVYDEAKGDDGFLDLLELDLIELGPTLKGANPLTQLVAAKSGNSSGAKYLTLEGIADAFGMKTTDVAELVASLETMDHDPAVNRVKAYVTIDGTLERLQEAITLQAQSWASDTYGSNLYNVYIEGTFTDRAVLYVELWDDPAGAGRYFEAAYTITGDAVTLDDPVPVLIAATITPKPRVNSRPATKSADPVQAEPETKTTSPGILRATLEADLIELGDR